MPGRNDPCPCGSGRKYKQCCQSADEQARKGPASPFEVFYDKSVAARKARDAGAATSTWQAEVVPLQISFDDQRDQRPVVVLITADGFVLNHDVRPRQGGEPDDVAAPNSERVNYSRRCSKPAFEK